MLQPDLTPAISPHSPPVPRIGGPFLPPAVGNEKGQRDFASRSHHQRFCRAVSRPPRNPTHHRQLKCDPEMGAEILDSLFIF